jgi:protein-S-isoprenylcysteine O-methyltransferase Ste14
LQIHRYIFWACASFEIFTYLRTLFPPNLQFPADLIPSQPISGPIRTTPLFIIGVFAVLLGTYIRLDCYRALGPHFTFHLTVLPDHKLTTNRFYAHVRHPSYTGSMLLVVGLTLSHLAPGCGSWLAERLRALSGSSGTYVAVGLAALWWAWTLAVGVSRAQAEDKEMKKLFAEEWDVWAARVPWWFFPGLL